MIKIIKKYFTITNPIYLKQIFENNVDTFKAKNDELIINTISKNPLIRLFCISDKYDNNIKNLEYTKNLINKENNANFFVNDPLNYIFLEKKLDLAYKRTISRFELKELNKFNYFPTHWTKTVFDYKILKNFILNKKNIKIEDNESEINKIFDNLTSLELTEYLNKLIFGENNELNNYTNNANNFMYNTLLDINSNSFLVGLNEIFMRMKLLRLMDGDELLNNFIEYCIENKSNENNIFILNKIFFKYDKAFINSILLKSIINDIMSNRLIPPNFNEFNFFLDETTYNFLLLILQDDKISETWNDLHFKMLNNYNEFNLGKVMKILGIMDNLSSTQILSSKYIKDPFFFLQNYYKNLGTDEYADMKKNFFLGYKKSEFFINKLTKEHGFIFEKNTKEERKLFENDMSEDKLKINFIDN